VAWQARCPRCSASVGADSATCPACGTDLSGQVLLLTDATAGASAPATVVTAGGGRRPGWVAAAAVAAVAVVVAVLAAVGGDEAEPVADPAPTSTTTTPGSTVPPAGTPGGRGEVMAREGTLLAGESPPTLLVDDGSLALVDLATGRVTHPGTPVPVDLGAPIVPREGGVVVVDRRGVAHALSPDLHEVLGDLGGASPLPSAVPDRVWLTTVDRTPGGGLTVEEHDLSGERIGPTTSLLPEVAPMAGVDAGLLIQTPAGIYLLPPDGGRPRQAAGGQYLGAGGSTVARYDCEGELTCQVHITDLATGTDVVPQLSGGALGNAFVPRLLPGVATFAAGGGLAAVACACAAGEGIAVVATDDGTVLLEAAGLNEPHWSPDGRWLFGTSAGIVYAWPAEGGDLHPIDVALRGARLVAVLP
jgi:hypothetical protein